MYMFPAFGSRALCPNATWQSKYHCSIAENKVWGGIQYFFTRDIFCLDATVVKRIRGCVADSILVDVYWQTYLLKIIFGPIIFQFLVKYSKIVSFLMIFVKISAPSFLLWPIMIGTLLKIPFSKASVGFHKKLIKKSNETSIAKLNYKIS